ncbi:hypothetical protein HZS_5021 [Henneguya salminicola]|nr:hypothetical protein HZS_5021 [Henneguya salminicola]
MGVMGDVVERINKNPECKPVESIRQVTFTTQRIRLELNLCGGFKTMRQKKNKMPDVILCHIARRYCDSYS